MVGHCPWVAHSLTRLSNLTLEWVKQQTFISHGSGGWKSKIRVQIGFLVRTLCLAYRWQTSFWPESLQGGAGGDASPAISSSYEDTSPIMGASPPWLRLVLIISQRPHLCILSYWGLGLQHMNLGGHIPPITLCVAESIVYLTATAVPPLLLECRVPIFPGPFVAMVITGHSSGQWEGFWEWPPFQIKGPQGAPSQSAFPPGDARAAEQNRAVRRSQCPQDTTELWGSPAQPTTAFLWEVKTSPVALLLLGRFCVWSRASSAENLPPLGAGRRYSLRNTLSLTLAWASHPQGVHMTVLLWTCLLQALSSGHQGPHLTPPRSLGADPRLLQRNGHSWSGLGLVTLCWFWCPHHKAGYLLFTVSPPGNQQRSKWEKRL